MEGVEDRFDAALTVGRENVVPASDEVFGDVEQAVAEGEAWIAARRAAPDAAPAPAPPAEGRP